MPCFRQADGFDVCVFATVYLWRKCQFLSYDFFIKKNHAIFGRIHYRLLEKIFSSQQFLLSDEHPTQQETHIGRGRRTRNSQNVWYDTGNQWLRSVQSAWTGASNGGYRKPSCRFTGFGRDDARCIWVGTLQVPTARPTFSDLASGGGFCQSATRRHPRRHGGGGKRLLNQTTQHQATHSHGERVATSPRLTQSSRFSSMIAS